MKYRIENMNAAGKAPRGKKDLPGVKRRAAKKPGDTGYRASPWRLQWYVDGEAHSSWHATKEEAEAARDSRKSKFGDGPAPEGFVDVYRRLAAEKIDPVMALEAALKRGVAMQRVKDMTFEDGIAGFLQSRRENGERETTIASYGRLFPSVKGWLKRMMGSITESEFLDWINQTHRDPLPSDTKEQKEAKLAKGKWSWESKKTYLRVLRTLYTWSKVPFPAPSYKLPKPPELDSIVYWSLTDFIAAAICTEPQYRGNLACAAFHGLRPYTVNQLQPGWFNEAEKKINIPAWAMKNRRALEYTGESPLWAWIARYPVVEMNWDLQSEKWKRRGVKYHQDIARHTCGSFFYKRGGAALAGSILGHARHAILMRYYANQGVSPADCARFFELTPDDIYPHKDWQLEYREDWRPYAAKVSLTPKSAGPVLAPVIPLHLSA